MDPEISQNLSEDSETHLWNLMKFAKDRHTKNYAQNELIEKSKERKRKMVDPYFKMEDYVVRKYFKMSLLVSKGILVCSRV